MNFKKIIIKATDLPRMLHHSPNTALILILKIQLPYLITYAKPLNALISHDYVIISALARSLIYSTAGNFISYVMTPCCNLMSVKTDSEVKQAVSLIQSQIRTSAYNPTIVPKHTIQKKSQCYSCYNDHNFFYFFFLSKFVCYALYSAIEKLESPLICVM